MQVERASALPPLGAQSLCELLLRGLPVRVAQADENPVVPKDAARPDPDADLFAERLKHDLGTVDRVRELQLGWSYKREREH